MIHCTLRIIRCLSFQVLGTKTLQEILIERDKIDTVIQVKNRLMS